MRITAVGNDPEAAAAIVWWRLGRLVRHGLLTGALALSATAEVSIKEFVEMQKLPDEELRRLFKLASSCEPAMSAVGLGAKVRVTVTCVDDERDSVGYSDDKPH